MRLIDADAPKKYCRYCAFCFKADDFRCSNHPRGEQPHWNREQINRETRCKNFVLSDLGDVETGRQYARRKAKRRTVENGEHEQMRLF